MGYIRFRGVKYGIVLNRRGGIFSSILCNIPLICRLYTKKIKISLTSMTPEGAPIIGTFGIFRIFKKAKNVSVKFMTPNTFYNVLAIVSDSNTGDTLVTRHITHRRVFWPGTEYSLSMVM